MGTTVAPVPTTVGTIGDRPLPVKASDAFQVMDLLDEEALRQELEGMRAEELVYVVKADGKEHTGLSKVGVDECCRYLAQKGEVIREESISHTIVGQGEGAYALFQCVAARYFVGKQGGVMTEVKLDQAIGLKRQPLFFDAAIPLTLDVKCPGKKPNGRTFRQMLEQDRDYLAWMADNFKDEAVRTFVTRILDGEDATIQPGRQENPFWFEAGGMKAARNARFRLIPLEVQAVVVKQAKDAGKVKNVNLDQRGQPQGAAPAAPQEPKKPQEPITRDTVFPFGTKVKGLALKDIPTPFLRWATEQNAQGQLAHTFAPPDVIDAWEAAMQAELALREKETASKDPAAPGAGGAAEPAEAAAAS